MSNLISARVSELPNLVEALKNIEDPTDVILLIDYDDCLEPSTERSLTGEQKQILDDLNELTNGGVIITTNSDGRTVAKVLQNYPIISEFSTVFRYISPDYWALYKHEKPTNCKVAFEAVCAYAEENNINLTEDAANLKEGATPSIKPELKEMGLCFVFGQHACMKDAAIEMANAAWATGAFDPEKYEIEIGKDAVEIKVKGAAKADVIDDIQRFAHFAHLRDRRTLVAMGDSGSDLEVMHRTGLGIVVGDDIKKEKLDGIDHVRLSSANNDFNESWDLLRRLRDTWKARFTSPTPQSARAPSAP